MKYISIETVANAYEGFQDCMTNKSWGYMALLKGCKSSIRPSVPYVVDLDVIANFLEDIFNLSQTKRKYEGGRLLYAVFSNKWEHYFNDQGKSSPNIYDVIAWAYRRKSFSDDITIEDIVNAFSIEFNIPSYIIANSFDTQVKHFSFSDSLYSESQLKAELSQIGVDVSKDNIDAKGNGIVASPGEVSRGPFIQTLYAGLEITDYVIIMQSDYVLLYGNKKDVSLFNSKTNYPLQQIFYGAPGTGKSNTIKRQTAIAEKEGRVIRTTFHPDSDYSTFVGAYKPTTIAMPMRDVTGKVIYEKDKPVTENRIVYEFVPQAFLKAYTGAWKNQTQPFFLIIEEINRGNCAQIFGDLFQLLDRNDEGESDYPISPDEDIQKFLLTDKKYGFAELTEEQAAAIPEEIRSGELLKLPKNLHIWATMNTSDQSLFPIDSAFKRRWDWRYMPISDGKKGWLIEANGKRYDWWQFLQKMNEKIGSTTNSEDKKLGYFFCNAKHGIIDAETFVSKVVFYIWNDVFKDFAEDAGDLFKDVDDTLLSFNKFYTVGDDGTTKVVEEKVERLLQSLGIGLAEFDVEEEEDEYGNATISRNRNYDKFSINDVGAWGKNRLPSECMKKYIELNPNMPIEEVLSNWKSLGNIVPHFVESEEEYEARTDDSKRSYAIPCGDSVIYVAHSGFGNNGKVYALIEAVNKKNWGITIAKVEE